MQAVVEALTEHGVESTANEDGFVSVDVPCGGKDDERDCQELLAEIEALLTAKNLPFVPEEIEGRIVIRPPAS